mmetsp:Transcript_46714/g.99766  ORF Transcript_46714/g.99766 Transcript_46714/m.99766 type:complete len:247 (+) Transcript_46714:267-1007(+)
MLCDYHSFATVHPGRVDLVGGIGVKEAGIGKTEAVSRALGGEVARCRPQLLLGAPDHGPHLAASCAIGPEEVEAVHCQALRLPDRGAPCRRVELHDTAAAGCIGAASPKARRSGPRGQGPDAVPPGVRAEDRSKGVHGHPVRRHFRQHGQWRIRSQLPGSGTSLLEYPQRDHRAGSRIGHVEHPSSVIHGQAHRPLHLTSLREEPRRHPLIPGLLRGREEVRIVHGLVLRRRDEKEAALAGRARQE